MQVEVIALFTGKVYFTMGGKNFESSVLFGSALGWWGCPGARLFTSSLTTLWLSSFLALPLVLLALGAVK